jgi:hypothetical protein
MMSATPERDAEGAGAESVQDLLLKLDRAMETLEALDELGVESRDELEALMNRLERQIEEAD